MYAMRITYQLKLPLIIKITCTVWSMYNKKTMFPRAMKSFLQEGGSVKKVGHENLDSG